MASIVPVVRALYLCDSYFPRRDGKVDLFGLFNALRPSEGYPYWRHKFCVFAQLVNGVSRGRFHVEIWEEASDELIWIGQDHVIDFPDRTTLVRMATTIEGCEFPVAGVYIVELYCDEQWMCDTQLILE